VISVFKIRFKKIREFYEIFKIRKKIHYITSLVTAKSSNSHNTSYSWEQSAVDYAEATGECEQWAVEDSDSDTGEDSEAAGDS